MADSEKQGEFSTGPFYIEEGCCLLCGVPESIAPELFFTGDETCHFLRQPRAAAEIEKTIEAMLSSEVDCIRYAGHDSAILRRLGEADLAPLADDPEVRQYRPVARDRVTFSLRSSPLLSLSSRDLAMAFRTYLQSKGRYTIVPSLLRRRRVTFAWFRRSFHSVEFSGEGERRLALLYPNRAHILQGLGSTVEAWLMTDAQAEDVEWHSKDSQRTGKPGSSRPF